MNKTAQQSLLDTLLQIMPTLKLVKNDVDKRVDKNLFDIWSMAKEATNRKVLKPANLQQDDIKKMTAAGLIEESGNYFRITEKGAQSLKVMILNDNSFALSKKASSSKSVGWFDKLKHESYLS